MESNRLPTKTIVVIRDDGSSFTCTIPAIGGSLAMPKWLSSGWGEEVYFETDERDSQGRSIFRSRTH